MTFVMGAQNLWLGQEEKEKEEVKESILFKQ